jgi:hypothetical protein
MALSVGRDGDLVIVDQANRRLQRFRAGQMVSSVPLPNGAIQDLALTQDGRVAALDRLVDANVRVLDGSGAVAATLPLVAAGLREGASATALFVDANGIYVEREHASVVRLAAADGRDDGSHTELWGRPSRDGSQLLRAAIFDRAAGDVNVTAHERASDAQAFVRRVRFGGPILHVMMLDSDARGSIYVAVDVGRESDLPPHRIDDEHGELVRLSRAGAPTGMLRIAPPDGTIETFRALTVADDGAVYQLIASDGGVEVVRWTFP